MMAIQSILEGLFEGFDNVPVFHVALEVVLLMLVIWLVMTKSYNPNDNQELTDKEKQTLIDEWIPEPLVPPNEKYSAKYDKVVSGKFGRYIEINNFVCINFGVHNYLCMNENNNVIKAAAECLQTYGMGSCGPRGFYGTTEIHLKMEKKLSEFMNCEEAVLYSYGSTTISSVIPAYCKRGDVIFVDERVHFGIQKGLLASRSQIKYFQHNNVDHLEQLLKEQAEIDAKNPKKARVTRKFLVIEGIYQNLGDICLLPELVALKNRYKIRLFVDETISFGVLGNTGKGVFQHFNVDVSEADLISGSLEHALGSVGGFTVGSTFIEDHQRLSALGYIFSASLPPMLAAGGLCALEEIEKSPSLIQSLHDACHMVHQALSTLNHIETPSAPLSPVKHLFLKSYLQVSWEEDYSFLKKVVQKCLMNKIAVALSSYLKSEEHFLPQPSIKIIVNNRLDRAEVDRLVAVLQEHVVPFYTPANIHKALSVSK